MKKTPRTLEEEVTACARAHGDLARLYDRHKNARGAAELRRVENLLWALRRSEPWSTVLPGDPPPPEPEDAVVETCLGCGGPVAFADDHRSCADAREAWIDAHRTEPREEEL